MPLTANQIADYFAQCRAADAAEKDQSPYQSNDYRSFMGGAEKFIIDSKGAPPSISAHNYDHYSWAVRELPNLLPAAQPWGQYEGRICQVLFHPKNRNGLFWGLDYWLDGLVEEAGEFDIMAYAAPALRQAGLKDEDIVLLGFDGDSDLPFLPNPAREDADTLPPSERLSSFGHFLLGLLPKQAATVVSAAMTHYGHLSLARLFYLHQRPLLYQFAQEMLTSGKGKNADGFQLALAQYLLSVDAPGFEAAATGALAEIGKSKHNEQYTDQFMGWLALEQHFPGRYTAQLAKLGEKYLALMEAGENKRNWGGYYDEHDWDRAEQIYHYLSVCIFKWQFAHDAPAARARLAQFMKSSPYLPTELLTWVADHFQAEALPYLAEALGKKPSDVDSDHFKVLFGLIGRYDFGPIQAQLWALANTKNKRVRYQLAALLAQLGEAAIPPAEKLLAAKAADQRQAGALILAKTGTEAAMAKVLAAFNNEKNDDARDVMLEALAQQLYAQPTRALVTQMVASAQQRGKLDAPPAPWLNPAKLPALTWADGNPVDAATLLFLLYRMGRAKGIRPDWEAKPVLALIDRASAGEFAKQLFRAYVDNGADAKQKYCLTLAGLLGNDDTATLLRTQVSTWADNARGKMAEYAVGALAMIGSNKALRAVEFFSRKFASKNANIGGAATAALEEAAEELGMDLNELADSIIPDFGFEGLFKTFLINGESYRGFIDSNFKMVFLDDDNRPLKSVPKGASKEQQAEFKEIAKEVRDVVKSQSPRLEQYLVTGRRWEPAAWRKFFLGNPIMFGYATRLVWGAYDAADQLLECFWCADDTTLYTLDDEELSQPATAASLGMVHPLLLAPAQRQAWLDKFADQGIEPIFPQMARPAIALPTKDQNLTVSLAFSGKKIEQGALFLAKSLEKRGWRRDEVSDGGYVPAYAKTFASLGVRAVVETEGISIGYYEEDAALGELYFQSVPYVSYDERLVFSQLPAIVYSEVMTDLQALLPEPEEEKE
jgi:Domain of unknown function (DUF4132)